MIFVHVVNTVESYIRSSTAPFNDSLFFFNDTTTTEIYTLSLHDALPIYVFGPHHAARRRRAHVHHKRHARARHGEDRKSTRLNSSHTVISYAVFCLKKKKCPRMRQTDM